MRIIFIQLKTMKIIWKENHDNDYYIKCFNEQVLSKLNATDVVLDFSRLSHRFNIGENDICLICYEKPSDFCHRHLELIG